MNREDCIEYTIEHYPELAKKGWLYYTSQRRDLKDSDKEGWAREEDILRYTKGWNTTHVSFAIWLNSVREDGTFNRNYYPVFVKTTKKKTLIDLGAIVLPKISIWELMDI
ncbi:hypothetical protein LCGC14_1269560 [marine sediment metagenome]|uniref:Uncharacterized protein n=1 Tax=marine sediment metagenome TaxID=412755 RepID=A0A0F9LJG8_9ZZZZ